MSYEPTNWKSGDVVTSAKLNKLEQGVANAGGGALVVHSSDADSPVLDKTWKEISDAVSAGQIVIVLNSYGDIGYLSAVPLYAVETETYFVHFFYSGNAQDTFVTDSENGYPVWTEG